MQNQCELDRLAEELTLHREVSELGTIQYYNERYQLHRIHGPALTYANGTEFWYKNGKHHRLDGPAITYTNGGKSWYINGIQYTEEDFNKHPDVIAYAKSK